MAGNEEAPDVEGDSSILDISACIAEKAEQSLAPLKEEVVDWLRKLFHIDINMDNFMEFLDNGVVVSQLAEMVHLAAAKSYNDGKTNNYIPKFDIRYHKKAKSGTFFARDNVAFFLEWCRYFGVSESLLFESDGLVMHKQPREVILCLLEVARLSVQYGIEPPGIVSLEKEIDEEIAQDECIDIENKEIDEVQIQTEQKAEPKNGAKKCNIDKEVRTIAKKHGVKVQKIKEGRYLLEGKLTIFVRILRYHIMVRVGGGWDTLDNFLNRHDVNKIGRILTVAPGSGKQLTSIHAF